MILANQAAIRPFIVAKLATIQEATNHVGVDGNNILSYFFN